MLEEVPGFLDFPIISCLTCTKALFHKLNLLSYHCVTSGYFSLDELNYWIEQYGFDCNLDLSMYQFYETLDLKGGSLPPR